MIIAFAEGVGCSQRYHRPATRGPPLAAGDSGEVDATFICGVAFVIQIGLNSVGRPALGPTETGVSLVTTPTVRSRGPVTPETRDPDRDYPQMVGDRGLIEPSPRRVRGYFDDVLVFDTTHALYVWEIAYYPQYYIPVSDVRMERLQDENHAQKLQFGSSRLHSLTSPERTLKSAARVYDSGLVADSVRFEWDALEWFEEDEPIIGHPRNPYIRVDSLRSHRHVKVELDGIVLAETHSPVLLFETGLPTRFYIDRTDVAFSHLEPSDTETVCPYKGITSGYWTVRVGEAAYPDLAWTYDYPLREVAPIAGMIAFYNEKLDIFVDGNRLPRPQTHFA